MKVEFCTFPFQDALSLWGLLHFEDPAGRKNRIESLNIPSDVAEKFSNANDFAEIEDFGVAYLEELHKKHSDQLEKAKNSYQKEWNEINDTFFKQTKEITEHSWKHDIYYVVVSPIHKGVSSLGGDTVLRSAFEDSKDQLRITAHELLMSHIWTVLWELYPSSKDNSDEFWALNELVTNSILGLDPVLNKLWTQKTNGYEEYLTNYPQLDEIKLSIKPKYEKTKGFKDFLEIVLQEVRKGK